jgi:uncharacterized protein (TIGR00369 family)
MTRRTNWKSGWRRNARCARLDAGAGCRRVARPEQVAGKSGLEVLRPCCAANCLTRRSPARWISSCWKWTKAARLFQGTPGPAHLNPMGTIHGGWYATLLDSALGCAVHTMMPAAAATPRRSSGSTRAIGTVIHCGRQLATAEGRIVGPDGKLYAHATTTCLVFEVPAQK